MTTITPDRLAEIVAELNAYEAAHPDAMSSDVWQDVILELPEYDPDSVDTSDESVAILTDGSEIVWDAPTRQWMTGQIGARS